MNILVQVKRKPFVECLIELVSVAISNNMAEEAEDLLVCVRQLRPKLDHLDYFEGWIAILRGNWPDAMRLAQGTIERTGDWPFATAMIAFCQYATGDGTWAVSAQRVLDQNESPEACALMRQLLGRVDPEESGIDPAVLAALAAGQEALLDRNCMRA